MIRTGREINVDLISVWFDGVIDRFGTSFVGYGFLGKFNYALWIPFIIPDLGIFATPQLRS